MCKCAVKKEKKSRVMTVKNSWRLRALFRIEKLIREVGQEARAKRMGYCGNTIFVKVKKGDPSNVLYEPQLRCKDRVCPVCNSYRASILSRKVEKLGKDMENPHLLTITANTLNRDSLKTAVNYFKKSTSLLKKERSWWKRYIRGGVEHIEITYKEGTGWHVHSHMLVDLAVDRKVENMQLTDNGYFLDPLKKDLEHVLLKVGLGTISDIRPVTEGYGKEISKYSMKFDLDIEEARLKEIIVDMKGKRMVLRFGNCYGQKEMEELTPKEEEQYETLGTIKEVVDKCFKETGVDSELVGFALGAVKIGLIELWSASYEPEPFQGVKNDSS
ncbi:phosphoenolpyruvate-protein kinase [Candidatus Scalindua japonica]|uniref:Phosphoenolpyruvate-protein kinase n=2 Tax=Candidatus Scalindua japonica TaxID=1284222 RepID=A0A286U2M0_9BACT|nr:phosphoenolpyruvate-protein kinase [Candidatus Scalindua japonica]